MKKRNIYLRIATLLLIASVATTGVFMGTGTTAKYVAEATVKAEARVATFDVRINASNTNIAQNYINGTMLEVEVDGVGSLLQPHPFSPAIPVGTAMSAHTVAPTGTILSITGDMIAPGTAGKVDITVHNHSEVAVKVEFIEIEGYEVTIPTGSRVEFSHTADGNDWHEDINDALLKLSSKTGAADIIGAVTGATGVIELPPKASGGTAGNTGAKSLYWRWPFSRSDDQDTADTKLGVVAAGGTVSPAMTPAADCKLTFKIGVRVTQID